VDHVGRGHMVSQMGHWVTKCDPLSALRVRDRDTIVGEKEGVDSRDKVKHIERNGVGGRGMVRVTIPAADPSVAIGRIQLVQRCCLIIRDAPIV